MFHECTIYRYVDLYLNEADLLSYGYSKAKGLELSSILQNCEDVFVLDNFGVECVAKKEFIEIIGSSEQEYFYIIRDGKFLLAPVQVYFGICKFDDEPIVFYGDKLERDGKLELVNNEGIDVISQDIEKTKGLIQVLQNQKKLKNAYNSIRMIIE